MRREQEEKDSEGTGRTPGTGDQGREERSDTGERQGSPWLQCGSLVGWGQERSARCSLVKADWPSYPQDMTTDLGALAK